jgi:hypothetical protein
MSDHERYEELAALFAGGFLSEQEDRELREHAKVCPECLKAEAEFSGLFRSGLPLTSAIREFLQRARTQSYDGIRDRFLQRARREGVIFSADVYRTGPRRTKRVWTIAAATVALAMVLLVTLYGSGINNRSNVQAKGTVERSNTAAPATEFRS